MIIRTSHNKDNPYVLLNKKTLELPDLSFKAKGLWAYLISKPDNWQVSIKHLTNSFQEGRDAIRSILKELIGAGLCEFKHEKNSSGQYLPGEYILYETPVLKKCLPQTGFPAPAPPPLISTDINNKKKKIKKKKEPPTQIPTMPADAGNGAEAPRCDSFKFGPLNNVLLTRAQHKELLDHMTEEARDSTIEDLSFYAKSHGKKYTDHYAAVRKFYNREQRKSTQVNSWERSKINRIDINKNFALEMYKRFGEQMRTKGFSFDVNQQYVEIKHTNDPQSFILKFEERSFEEDLKKGLRQRGINILEHTKI